MSFRSPLEVRTMASHLLSQGAESISRADEKSWILLEDLIYEVGELGSGQMIRVPRGFVTDFASVPRFLWWFIAPFGTHASAAVVHDYLYRHLGMRREYSRREADYIFREAMAATTVSGIRRTLMWLAVRSPGGWWAHRKNGVYGSKVLSSRVLPR